MAFSSILIGTFIVYFVYYSANFIYDLFLSGVGSEQCVEEEEIEISDAENKLSTTTFSPSSSSNNYYSPEVVEIVTDEEEVLASEAEETFPTAEGEEVAPFIEQVQNFEPAMNGGIDINTLVSTVQSSENLSELDFLAESWNHQNYG